MASGNNSTRDIILEAALWEMYRHGFQGASIDRILGGTKLTKGALYHHFPTKLTLGHAVVEERVAPWIREHWIKPVEDASDPIGGLKQSLRQAAVGAPDEIIHGGCPLNNLAQEMSNLDEGFRTRIEAVLDEWRTAIARRLADGQAAGTVRRDLDIRATAAGLVAAFEGVAAAGKAAKSRDHASLVAGVLLSALDALRPSPDPDSG